MASPAVSLACPYLGSGVGMIIGLALFSVLSDQMLKKQAGDGILKPEYRLPLMVYFKPIIPIGFFWYGWSAYANVHWIVPIVGTGFYRPGLPFRHCTSCGQTS